jgi:hypothetical protein
MLSCFYYKLINVDLRKTKRQKNIKTQKQKREGVSLKTIEYVELSKGRSQFG